MASLYCGTSGFSYASWKPAFYPEGMPSRKFLNHYAQRLNAVEINYTFRSLASAATFDKWIAETADGFLFAPKAHQRITHIDRLELSDFTGSFFASLNPLKAARRLGPVLVQLPPKMPEDADRLRRFLDAVPQNLPLTFEFRDRSWFSERIYQALRDHNAALCLAESDDLETPDVLTASFAYLRLRKSSYEEQELAAIAQRAGALLSGGRDVYLFFKHEDTPEGALQAERMLKRPDADRS